ncbi:hypothetical protein O181_002726 [Austropuccinia psidii MF-1]|uniref:Tc1-like transposase DDE domain-containing protein n=1 Tax=Austropuccinia psidii MF-1 TaxID=1389203 RepID=A0A9Q3BDI4_9BASI|nr:hypothetical protein [Austropuccinia psidii MF-1]
MDITWKQVTNIPASWNKEDLLTQRANFVNCRGRGFGYAPSGQPAVLSLVPRVKQITLIAAISDSGFVYHEILNANGQMTKGVGSDEFALFLLALQFKIPNDSIVIMDNAPIHQGQRFEEVKKTLESSKGIKIEFLPPYSPFLNPIELSFHSIKSFVRSQEPRQRSELVKEIENAITQALTPEKCKNFFLHCKKFYRSCHEMQPITGALLAAP